VEHLKEKCFFNSDASLLQCDKNMIEQVASNKLSLLQKNILQKMQTYQPLTMNIETESILKGY
jgi:hypothetical protein